MANAQQRVIQNQRNIQKADSEWHVIIVRNCSVPQPWLVKDMWVSTPRIPQAGLGTGYRPKWTDV